MEKKTGIIIAVIIIIIILITIIIVVFYFAGNNDFPYDPTNPPLIPLNCVGGAPGSQNCVYPGESGNCAYYYPDKTNPGPCAGWGISTVPESGFTYAHKL